MALTTVDAVGVFLYYSTDSGVTYKSIVCEVDSSLNSTMEITSDATKCGTTKGPGSLNTTITGNAVVNTTPDTGEGSYEDIQTIMLAKTSITWKYTNVAEDIYHTGVGWFTQLGNQNPASGASKFSWTIEVNGDYSNTPTS